MKKFVTIGSVKTKVHQLVTKNEEEMKTIDFVVGMSRGGLIPAVLLATEINKPLVTIYIDKQDNFYLDRTEWLQNKTILFVDDVCRTGSTMFGAVLYLKNQVPTAVIKVMTLFDIVSIEKKTHPQIAHKSQEDVLLPWDYDRK